MRRCAAKSCFFSQLFSIVSMRIINAFLYGMINDVYDKKSVHRPFQCFWFRKMKCKLFRVIARDRHYARLTRSSDSRNLASFAPPFLLLTKAHTTQTNNQYQPMSPPYFEPEDVEPTTNEVKSVAAEPEKPYVYSREVEQDRELKKHLVLDLVEARCNEASKFQDFRVVGEAIKAGDKLHATVISGGATNYSYKVFLEKGEGPAFFAKICFPYALWNPDRNVFYDTDRTVNEFKIMKRVNELMGDDTPVATPYLCEDVDGMKILVCEWSQADEQFANQFIDGEVDHRVVSKVAEALATLNLMPFDEQFGPDFNDSIRPSVETIFPLASSLVAEHIATKESADACVAYLKEMGQERFDEIMNKSHGNFMTRDCLTHGDTQCFNILVEQKPSKKTDQAFSDSGEFAICDWEMACSGPYGRDAGFFQGWPIACALYHAAHGRKEVAYDLLECCIEFWDEYAKVLVKEVGKNEAFLTSTYRASIGWNSLLLFNVFYLMRMLIEHLPMDELSNDMVSKFKGSMGLVGIQLMEYGFGEKEADLTIDELRLRFRSVVENEIEELLEAATQYQAVSRHSSSLRASGRRVKDASLVVSRRLSQSVVFSDSFYNDSALRRHSSMI